MQLKQGLAQICKFSSSITILSHTNKYVYWQPKVQLKYEEEDDPVYDHN